MIDDGAIIALGGITTAPVTGAVALLSCGYTHPAIADRVIVRLVPQPLVAAENATVTELGCIPVTPQGVGFIQDRAAGFPGWALQRYPRNRRRIRRLAGVLAAVANRRNQPALGKGLLYDEIPGLKRSAPQLLPSFLEEGARIMLRAGLPRHAQEIFSTAREYERQYDIPVDEQRHHTALLEFASAGALGAGELSQQARAGLHCQTPTKALELFIRLNVLRIDAGLPPYAALGSDLRHLAAAAQQDHNQITAIFLSHILGKPALDRAPARFWADFGSQVDQLGGQRPPDPNPTPLSEPAPAPPSLSVAAWFLPSLRDIGLDDATLVGLADALPGSAVQVPTISHHLYLPLVLPEALLACAMGPTQSPTAIEGAELVVRAVLAAQLYTPSSCLLAFPGNHRVGEVISLKNSYGVVLDSRQGRSYVFSQHGCQPNQELVVASNNINHDALLQAFHQLRLGRPRWQRTWALELSASLNWPESAAALLLAGVPVVTRWGYEASPQLRKLLNLKVKQVDAALEFLETQGRVRLLQLLAAGAHDPVQAVTNGLDIQAMIDHYEGNKQ